MATYNKKIVLNGEKVTVTVGFSLDNSKFVTTSDNNKTTYSNSTYTIFINELTFENAFTSVCTESKKTGKNSVSYICNKTGVRLPDSHNKLVQHILSMQN
jgi:hypothetical protein